MKKDFTPKFLSSSSYAKKQTIPIDMNSPVFKSLTSNFKISRLNAEVSPVGLNKSVSGYLMTLQNSTSGQGSNTGPTGGSGGGTPTPTLGQYPAQVTNLSAAWATDGTGNLILTFTFDLNDPQNQYFSYIAVELKNSTNSAYYYITPSSPYDSTKLSSSSTSQTLTISAADWKTTGIPNAYIFNGVGVATYDTLGQTAGYVTATLTQYVSQLPAPIITEADSTSAYTITTTNLTSTQTSYPSLFASEIIQEYITTTVATGSQSAIQATIDAEAAGAAIGWTQVGEPRTFSPTTIFANDGKHRYVRAYFLDTANSRSSYSNYVEATPTSLIPNNTVPPSAATSVSGAFTNSGAGNDVTISYTLPSINNTDVNRAISLKIKLVPTASSGLTGYFYHTITPPTSPSTTSPDTSFTILSSQLYAQFGSYYGSFSGTLVTVSQSGVESTTISTINTFTRTNSLANTTPSFTVSNLIDGYSVSFNLATTTATYGSVYQFFIDPRNSTNGFLFASNNINFPDYMDTGTATSATGTSIVVPSITGEGGAFALSGTIPYIGYKITGTNVPDNTWVTAISGSGPYTLTLNNSLTATGSGSYHMQAAVYNGSGPANVFNNYYAASTYVVVAYYDNFGNRSKNGFGTAQPTNPSISVISNAVQVGSGGAIYVGSSATTGSRIVLGPSQKAPDGSQYSGIFAFDYGSVAGQAASTSIITNPSATSVTFETVNAKIGDWYIGSQTSGAITSNVIQNTLGSSTSFTGLSPSSPTGYSFWAGSKVSGGDISNFAVTPTGTVYARNLRLSGGTLDVGGTSVNTTATASSGVSNITVASATNISAGMYIIGEGIPNNTIVGNTYVTNSTTVPLVAAVGGTTVNTTAALSNTSVNFISSDGAHISSSGILTATGANITGSLTVNQQSYFNSNINLQSNAYIIAGSRVTNGVVIAATGLLATDTTGATTTQISSSPIGTSADNLGITFQTNGAFLGKVGSNPWVVANSKIYSYSGAIELNSNTNTITLNSVDASGTYGLKLSGSGNAGTTGGTVTPAIAVGSFSSPNFSVGFDGTMTANNAVITGTIHNSGKTTQTTGTGYWFNSNGTFNIGNTGSNYISWDNTTLSVYGNLRGGSKTTSSDITTQGYFFDSSGNISITSQTNGSYLQFNSSTFKINMSSSDSVQMTVGTISGTGDRAYSGGMGFNMNISKTYSGAYSYGSQIGTTQSGTLISGLPIQGDADLFLYSGSAYGGGIGHYQGMGSGSTGLGPYPRQRMIIEDARTGNLMLGMAVYYRNAGNAGSAPTSGSGYIGDLWVDY
jgi:hypothetical protein